MANIRKQFNFRNGVQVDDDNLIVTPSGLVGIGTTVPTELLDVRGTAKVVGLVTATEIFVTDATVEGLGVSSITLGQSIVGSGISIKSGIVTSNTSTGIVTYYGDGRFLEGLPSSQWVDVDAGLGFTSIYAQGFVGVGTVDPRFLFQVSGNADSTLVGFTSGVGISSGGNILATGIVTAYKFSGIGSNITQLNASNIDYGTISPNRVGPIFNSSLPSNIQVSGIITAQTRFSGDIIGDVTGNVVGNVTGNVVGIATTASDLTSDARVTITSVTSNLSRSGVSTVDTRLDINGLIGIGTTGSSGPQSDIHIFKPTNASLQVTGEVESLFVLGRSISKFTNTAGLKFGNTTGVYTYSNTKTFDIINYDLGNVNSYLHLGTLSGINTGSFNWIYGQDPNNPLLTLTYQGNLGIGYSNPNPSRKLSVNGNAYVSGLSSATNVSVASSVTTSDLYVTGTLSIPPIPQTNLNLISGISTFYDVKATNTAFIGNKLGVGTNFVANTYSIQVGDGTNGNVVTIFNNGIAIGSTTPSDLAVNAQTGLALFGGIGVGTDTIRCGADFGEAGKGAFNDQFAFMVPPRLTTSQRNALIPLEGAFIYNLETKKFQGYVGTGWTDFN